MFPQPVLWDSSGKQTMTEALLLSANFRWQVQNTGHRSDHKCKLEYRSPSNTLWSCKGEAVWMKGNKPSVHSRARFCTTCAFLQPPDANNLFLCVSVMLFCEGMILQNNKTENKISSQGAWDLDILLAPCDTSQ